MNATNILSQAKRNYERALAALSDSLLLTDREVRKASEAWQELYYAAPPASQAEKRLTRLEYTLSKELPLEWERVHPLVLAAIDAAKVVVELKGTPKPARARASSSLYNRYSFSQDYTPVTLGPLSIRPGAYLMLRYGNGLQLAYVARETGPLGLDIFRLTNRGHSFASWEKSHLSRKDSRILGFAQPCALDPKLPEVVK